MASTSEIKVGMDAIASIVAAQRAEILKLQQGAQTAANELANIPTTYADLIATVTAFTNGNAYQNAVKAELISLGQEYTALKAAADSIVAVET